MAFCLFVHMCTCFDGVYWLPVLVKQYNNAAVYDSPETQFRSKFSIKYECASHNVKPRYHLRLSNLSGPLLKYNVKLLNACNPEQSANMSLSVVLAIQIMNTTLISVPCVVGGQSPKLYRSTPGVVPHLTLQWIAF